MKICVVGAGNIGAAAVIHLLHLDPGIDAIVLHFDYPPIDICRDELPLPAMPYCCDIAVPAYHPWPSDAWPSLEEQVIQGMKLDYERECEPKAFERPRFNGYMKHQRRRKWQLPT